MSTTVGAITAEQIKDMLYKYDLIQRPFALIYNPNVEGLRELLEKELLNHEKAMLLIPDERVEENKVYVVDRKAIEDNYSQWIEVR